MTSIETMSPEVTQQKISELRKLITDNNYDTRTDDEFLERFLRLRRYDAQKAFNKLKHYEDFRKKEESFAIIKRSAIKYVLESKCADILETQDSSGKRILWIRPGLWDPSVISSDELLQVTGLMADAFLAKYKDEMIYTKIIFDMHNFGMKHVQALSTKFAKKMVHFLHNCIPALIHSIYIVREPKVFTVIYNCFKPFLDDGMKNHIKFLGQDLKALHGYINAEALPQELGGTCVDISPERWFGIIDSPEVQEDLQKSGYKFLS